MPASAVRVRLALAVLSVGAFVGFLNFTLLSPLVRPIGAEFGVPDALTGQLATVASAASVVGSLLGAPWMDRFSRRSWIRAEAVVLIAATLLAALAPSFGWLVAARALAGLGGALVMANCLTAARALSADAAGRTRAIGVIVSATTVGSIVGLPGVAQLEAALGWRAAMAAPLLPLAVVLLGSAWVPGERPAASARLGAVATLRGALGSPAARWLYGVLAVVLAVNNGWLTFVGAYVERAHGAGAAGLGVLFLLSGLATLVGNNLTPPLLARVGAARAIALGAALLGAPLLLMGIAVRSLPAAVAAAALVGTAAAGIYIGTSALLLERSAAAPGAAMALAGASVGAGAALGPLLAGGALALLGSYDGAFRVLGALAPLIVVFLLLGERAARPASVAAEGVEGAAP